MTNDSLETEEKQCYLSLAMQLSHYS